MKFIHLNLFFRLVFALGFVSLSLPISLFNQRVFAASGKFNVKRSKEIKASEAGRLVRESRIRKAGAVFNELYPPCQVKGCKRPELIDVRLYKNKSGQYFFKFVVLTVNSKGRNKQLIRFKEAGAQSSGTGSSHSATVN